MFDGDDPAEIAHTTDYEVMLREALETETQAAKGYKGFLDLPGIDSELYDAIEQIYFQEERSIEELSQLLDSRRDSACRGCGRRLRRGLWPTPTHRLRTLRT
jgi:hypothetical protein